MKYGYFRKSEYVIDNPQTPKSWINYLGTDQYCALIDNNAGGYSFFQSPKTGRLLRYRFNGIPMSRSGRYIYVRDTKSADFWSVSWQPTAKDLKKFKTETVHGQGYTIIKTEYDRIRTTATYYVPLQSEREIWSLDIENLDDKARELDIFTYAEIALWYSVLDTFDLQYILYTARTTFTNNAISFHHRNGGGIDKHAYFTSTEKADDFDTDRDTFIGPYRDESNPLAIELGKCSKSFFTGGNPCASLRHRIRLEKKGRKKITFILSIGKFDWKAVHLRNQYSKDLVEREIDKIKESWTALLGSFSVNTPDKDVNVMANVWNQYQCHTTFNWSRSASFIEASGRDGLGYRDSSQDVLGVLHVLPERVKKRIIDLLQGQVSDGSALHQIQPLTMTPGKGEKPDIVYSDDHLWPILSIAQYLKETGDFNFLNEIIPFHDTGKADVFEHMKRAIDFSLTHKGKHDLCLGLYADWNDCINLRGGGESVWTTLFLYKVMGDFLDIARLEKKTDVFEKYSSFRKELGLALNHYGWNGQWFNRAYLDNGKVIGSPTNTEGKIFINPQSWAILSGLADKDQTESILASVEKHLSTKYGIVLLWPAYTEYDGKIGSITGYPKGLKENASIFCHTVPWMVIANTIAGKGDQAFRYFRNILPSHFNDNISKFTEAPYAYVQFISGKENKKFGRAENPWLTGSATWNFVALSQHILGIRPDYDGLVVDPCIPRTWKKFEVKRVFRGATYNITVKNPDKKSKGVRKILLNGNSVNGVIPVQEPGSENTIEVTM
jgi:N,N'-diacetylchitobiose phosphorylase